MIKVIAKALNILEFLGGRAGEPASLSAIARELNMHPATAANILLALAARQYVEQIAPRKGYLLGPAAFRFTGRGSYRQDLTDLARPHLEDLARATGETVQLATLRAGARFVLCQMDSSRSIRVGAEYLFQATVYTTATGRLLLAYLDAGGLAATLERLGAPGENWPEAVAPGALERELAAIRARGWLSYKTPSSVVGMAFPIIPSSGRVSVALGLFLPAFRFTGAHRKAIQKHMKETAAAISNVWPDQSDFAMDVNMQDKRVQPKEES